MEDGKAVNKLRVLYEDNHVIVVVKEKNVLSQADNTHDIDMLIEHTIWIGYII